MATNVILPALGIAQDTGKIVAWLKAEGERVTQGEPIVTIETDKAAVDLEAEATGILARVSARVGDEVPVAQVIAVILADDEVETEAPLAEAIPALVTSPVTLDSVQAAPDLGPSSYPAATRVADVPARNGRRAASPKARRIAAERGVDIAALHGSGPGGVVLAADVLAAVASPPERSLLHREGGAAPAIQVADHAPAVAAGGEGGGSQGQALTTVWRLMAERTTQSWTSVPHFFLLREVNATRLMTWRERAEEQVSAGRNALTYTDLLVKIVAEALRRHPRLNASWSAGAGGTIKANEEINVGIAVATEQGLVVPVIHRTDELSLRGISRQRTDLVARAQAGQLRLHELQGGTFTISNLGMYGIDAFTAIINAPQAAILAVGRIADRVVPVDGKPAVRPILALSLSCDHRVVDGARGAQFLATVAALIEDPSELTG